MYNSQRRLRRNRKNVLLKELMQKSESKLIRLSKIITSDFNEKANFVKEKLLQIEHKLDFVLNKTKNNPKGENSIEDLCKKLDGFLSTFTNQMMSTEGTINLQTRVEEDQNLKNFDFGTKNNFAEKTCDEGCKKSIVTNDTNELKTEELEFHSTGQNSSSDDYNNEMEIYYLKQEKSPEKNSNVNIFENNLNSPYTSIINPSDEYGNNSEKHKQIKLRNEKESSKKELLLRMSREIDDPLSELVNLQHKNYNFMLNSPRRGLKEDEIIYQMLIEEQNAHNATLSKQSIQNSKNRIHLAKKEEKEDWEEGFEKEAKTKSAQIVHCHTERGLLDKKARKKGRSEEKDKDKEKGKSNTSSVVVVGGCKRMRKISRNSKGSVCLKPQTDYIRGSSGAEAKLTGSKSIYDGQLNKKRSEMHKLKTSLKVKERVRREKEQLGKLKESLLLNK